MERLKNPKLIAALLVALVALVIVFQNREPVEVRVLWLATVKTSLAAALSGAFLIGWAAGALSFTRWRSKREKAKAAEDPTEN